MAGSGIFMYVSHHKTKEISVWQMSDSGELSSVQNMSTGAKVMPLTVSPNQRFLYAGLREKPWSIATYRIDGQSGRLTHLSSIPAFESTVYLCTDKSGRFLFSAINTKSYDTRTGNFSVNAIGERGCAQSPYEMFRTPVKLHSVQIDPSNRYLFGASCDTDQIVRYKFDAVTGTIDPDPLPAVMVTRRMGPRHMVFHPNNRFLYLLGEYSADVYVFRYDPNRGSLHEIQVAHAFPSDFAPVLRGEDGRLGLSNSGADLHFTPDGRWLYASARGPSTIAAFGVDPATGLLTAAGHFPMPSEPRGFHVDPTGRFLVSAGERSANLAVSRINPETGALTRLKDYEVGAGPNWIEFVML